MPNRILKESLCSSPNVDLLSAEEERLFVRLIVICDDYGRADARPAMIRARCFPLKVDSISIEDVDGWLAALVRAGLIRRYEVEARPYLEMRTWRKHQQVRTNKSKFPQPPAEDEACNQLISIDCKCDQMPTDAGNGKHMSPLPGTRYPVPGTRNMMPPTETIDPPHASEPTQTSPDAPAGAGANAPLPLSSLQETEQSFLQRLREEKNKPGVLGEAFAFVFGPRYPPSHGRLGKLARDYGGAGEFLKLMFRAAVTQGGVDDPHDYLTAAVARELKDRAEGRSRAPPNGHEGPTTRDEIQARNKAIWENNR